MKKFGGYAKAISTPKEAKIGCGISAEISVLGVQLAKKLIKIKRYPSFHALFIVDKKSVRII